MAKDVKYIYIVDVPSIHRKALETQIVMQGDKSLDIRTFDALDDVVLHLDQDVKAIFIDLLQYPIENSIDFIGSVRNAYPWIVFVLWIIDEQYEQMLPKLPQEWRRRFGHYFKLRKNTSSASFSSDVLAALSLIDLDYEFSLQEPGIRNALTLEGSGEKEYSHSKANTAMAPLNRRAFISYARVDSGFADWLWQQLQARGISTWVDRKDIHPGQVWDDEIHRALLNCAAMLLVLTPESVESKNVAKEWKFFLNSERPVIPLLLKECTPHFQLVNLQYIDFRNYRPSALEELVSALKEHIPFD